MLEFDLINDKLNLIVGENWIWKSSLFDIIRLVLDSKFFLTNISDEDFKKDENNDEQDIFLELEFLFSKENNPEVLYAFKNTIINEGNNNLVCLVWLFIPKEVTKDLSSVWRKSIFYGWKSFIDDGLESRECIEKNKISLNEIKEFVEVYYIDWTRSAKDFYSSNSIYNKVRQYLYDMFKSNPDLINLWFIEEELKNLWILWEDFPEEINKLRLLQDKQKKIDLDNNWALSRSTFYSLLKLKLDNNFLEKNSVGWQYIFYTAFVIYYLTILRNKLNENNDEQDNKYYIILMEEPEAHLHPQMQRKLFNFVKDNVSDLDNAILLVSTHSPVITRTIKDIKKIILLNFKGNKWISLPKWLQSLEESEKNKLSIWIDLHKAEIYFSRWVIFVEWITEEILVPLLFEKYKDNRLEDYWISVINVNSTDFEIYVKYAILLWIPWVIITDGDITKEKSQWISRKRKIIINLIFFLEKKLKIISKRRQKQKKINLLYKSLFVWFDTFEIDFFYDNQKDNLYECIKEVGNSKSLEKLLKIVDCIDYKNKIYKNDCDTIIKNEGKQKSVYEQFFGSINKSQLAYCLYEKIQNENINIPDYIKQAFGKIINLVCKWNPNCWEEEIPF